MKILFIGGSGNISWNCVQEAAGQGHEVWALNRGRTSKMRRPQIQNAKYLYADINDPAQMREILKNQTFEVIIDFLCFNSKQANQRIQLFQGHIAQYIFISSTANYKRPTDDIPFRESTAILDSPWLYAANKIACEKCFLDIHRTQQFPITIIRPSHTYDTILPSAVGPSDWTTAFRILQGKSIILHGDGTSLWTLTHAIDFAKGLCHLIGQPQAIGEDYHITSDERLTWQQIAETIAHSLGVSCPKFIYIPSRIIHQHNEQIGNELLWHKSWCDLYDNSKLRSIAPTWRAEVTAKEGISRTISWFLESADHRVVDPNTCAILDRIAEYSSELPKTL